MCTASCNHLHRADDQFSVLGGIWIYCPFSTAPAPGSFMTMCVIRANFISEIF